uniref:Uncharacterized protein n=1 Tax=Romanomermis culicivorax TaxID=13658 RepID=A0A915LC08_ROMCU
MKPAIVSTVYLKYKQNLLVFSGFSFRYYWRSDNDRELFLISLWDSIQMKCSTSPLMMQVG